MAMISALDELNDHLSGWLVQWRLRQSLVWATRGAIVGLAVGLMASLVARARPLLPVEALVAFGLALALLGASLGIGVRWFWPVHRMSAARYFDLRFGLAERTSTALELARRGSKSGTPVWLIQRQAEDAVAAARGVDAARGLPMDWSRREFLAILALLAAQIASLALPNPMQSLLSKQQAVEAAIEAQVTQIEAIRQQIAADPSLTPELREALQAPLEEAQQRLESGQLSQEQAVSILTSAQTQLQQLADPQALRQGQNLQQAGASLGQNSSGPLNPVGEALANGDLQRAAEELANLDPSQMSASDQQTLADQLEGLARDLADTNPELSQQLQAAADALRQGNTPAAQQALQQASQTLSQTAGRVAQSQAAQQAASQLSQGRREVAQAGQAAGEGQQGQPVDGVEAIGQGDGQGSGEADGEGLSMGQGQGQGTGGGAGRGQGQGEAQSGEAGDDPISTNNNPGDGGEVGYEPIYSPYRLGGDGGPEVNLSGGDDPTGDVVGTADSTAGAGGQSGVPYNEVYGAYQQAASEAISSGRVPIGLRAIVKYYFSSLQP